MECGLTEKRDFCDNKRMPTTYQKKVRRVISNTPAYNYISRVRGNKHKGGGVSVGIDRSLVFRDMSELIPPSLAALELVLV